MHRYYKFGHALYMFTLQQKLQGLLQVTCMAEQTKMCILPMARDFIINVNTLKHNY